MKKIILCIIIILLAGYCKAQLRSEYYYPEKYFLSRYEKASNPSLKLDAAGELAIYYAWNLKDSLRDISIQKGYDLAAASQDPSLVVKAKFWDTYAHCQSLAYDETDYVQVAANDLLSYAEKYHFLEFRIAAYNILSWNFLLNNDYKEAEKYAITSSLWLEDIHNDSLRIEVYGSLAHIFIWERDGISASRYLLKLREYAEQEDNEVTRIQSIGYLEWLYFDLGEYQKAISYNTKLYQIYANKKMIYMQAGITGELMMCYMLNGDNRMKKYFSERFRKFQNSLDIVNFQTYWDATFRYWNKMLTAEEYIKLLKGNFGNRYFWPKAKVYFDIAQVFLDSKKLDSAEYYINLAKLNGAEKLHKGYSNITFLHGQLLYYKKEYAEALKVFSESMAKAKEKGNINNYIGGLAWSQFCCEQMKDYKKAIELLRERTNINDSLEKLNNKQEITMMEVEKDKEIADRKQKEKDAKLEHSYNVQYMGMALGAVAILFILILLGIIKARPWVIRSMSFFSFIFIFEFIILVLDKQIHHFTGGEPWKIILIKVFIIALLFPLHHFIERQVSHNLINKNISPGKWIKTIWGSRINKPEP